jgi:siderophore synthetase component
VSTPHPADATDVRRAEPDPAPVGAVRRARHAAAQPAPAALPGVVPPHGRATLPRTAPDDPLLDPDPVRAADHAAAESLLRCWLRETGAPPPRGATLRADLGSGVRVVAPVLHWSPAGWHRLGPVRLTTDTADGPMEGPVDAVTLAALLARGAAGSDARGSDAGGHDAGGREAVGAQAGEHEAGGRGAAGGEGARRDAVEGEAGAGRPHPGAIGDLVGRVADSARRTARFIAERRDAPEPPPGTTTFLDAEQALLLGHPLHPTPKSREGIGDTEAAAYSPELRGAVRLHWFGVHPDIAASDSALPVPAARITGALRGADAGPLPPSFLALPLHPWQAREVTLRPDVADLLDQGLLRDLGPAGPLWHPTSSVRTVHRPDAPYMLKLSLGVRITNSRRENLRKELQRGVEVHRLLVSGLAEQWHAAHPGFDIVRDPAWLAVDVPGVRGLDVVLRDNTFGPHERALCVAGLLAERPWTDPATGRPARSRLGDLLHALAARLDRPLGAVATEWFRRYLDAVVLPILWLDGHAGVALEAHHQNSLVLVDADGWPSGGRYRDNQGYYFRDSRAQALDARLPGIGQESDTFVPDPVADERFTYYLGINHLLGLIGAFGAQRLADERALLAELRRFLAGAARRSRSSLPQRLLDAPTLRCKANLLTRLHGMDELDGPVESQSVYVTIANPVAEATSAVPGAAS